MGTYSVQNHFNHLHIITYTLIARGRYVYQKTGLALYGYAMKPLPAVPKPRSAF